MLICRYLLLCWVLLFCNNFIYSQGFKQKEESLIESIKNSNNEKSTLKDLLDLLEIQKYLPNDLKKIESYKKLLDSIADKSNDDESKQLSNFHFMNILSYRAESKKLDSLIEILESSNNLSKKWQVIHRATSTKNFLQKNEPNKAFLLLNELEQEVNDLGNLELKMIVNDAIGYFHFSQGNFDKAINYYLKVLSYQETEQYNEVFFDKTRILNNVGSGFADLGNYKTSNEYLYKTLRLNVEQGNDIGMAANLANIGTNNMYFKDYATAIDFYNKSWKIIKRLDNKRFACYIKLWKGKAYYEQGLYEKALENINQAQEINSNNNSEFFTFEIFLILAKIYTTYNDTDLSERYFQLAINYSQEKNNVEGIIKCNIEYAKYLQDNNQFTTSKKVLLSTLSIAKAIKNNRLRAKTYELLSENYYKTNLYKQAYSYHKRFKALSDSLELKKNTSNNSTLAAMYNYEIEIIKQKEKIQEQEIELLKSENNQKTLIGTGVVLLFSVLIILVYLILKYKMKRKEIASKREHDHIQAVFLGQERERNRIAQSLHDGVNGDLSAFKFYLSSSSFKSMDPTSKKKIGNRLDDIISQVRAISHNLSPTLLIESTVDDSIKGYLNLLPKTDELTISFRSYGKQVDLHPNYKISIYRIVQEQISNILKHSSPTKVVIQVNYHNDYMSITIEDDGSFFDYKNVNKGLGLNNIESRVKMLKAINTYDSNEYGTTRVLMVYYDSIKNIGNNQSLIESLAY